MRKHKSTHPVVAASATYRTAVNGIYKALKKAPKHSNFPRSDLDAALSDIPVEMRKKAISWYKKGLREGLRLAKDMMASGEIYNRGGAILGPDQIEVELTIKSYGVVSGSPISIVITSDEVGFDVFDEEALQSDNED